MPSKHSARLKLTRMIWLVLVACAISMFVLGIPFRFTELQQPCQLAPIDCSNRMIPTAAELAQLIQDGLTPNTYTLILTGFAVLSGLVYSAIGLLIFVRQPNNLGAMVISLALILLGTSNAMWNALAQEYPIFQPLVHVLFFVSLHSFALIIA